MTSEDEENDVDDYNPPKHSMGFSSISEAVEQLTRNPPDFSKFAASEEIKELVEEVSESDFALGTSLPPDKVDALDDVLVDTGVDTADVLVPSDPKQRHSSLDVEELPVDHEKANVLLKAVYETLHDRQQYREDIQTLVLGLPQYRVLEPYSQAEHNKPLELLLPVDDIVVVPGPMIHAALPPEVELAIDIEETDTE